MYGEMCANPNDIELLPIFFLFLNLHCCRFGCGLRVSHNKDKQYSGVGGIFIMSYLRERKNGIFQSIFKSKATREKIKSTMQSLIQRRCKKKASVGE
jgi:hypothetical protein